MLRFEIVDVVSNCDSCGREADNNLANYAIMTNKFAKRSNLGLVLCPHCAGQLSKEIINALVLLVEN